jgi:hypothetical protein
MGKTHKFPFDMAVKKVDAWISNILKYFKNIIDTPLREV